MNKKRIERIQKCISCNKEWKAPHITKTARCEDCYNKFMYSYKYKELSELELDNALTRY